MSARRLSRRTLLRAAGVGMALPALDAMMPRSTRAQLADTPKRFFGFFYPNGTDARFWDPETGPLNAGALPQCLSDLNGFGAEGLWPAQADSLVNDVTVVKGIDHSGVCLDIHMPSLALCAHKGAVAQYIPSEATLDQVLADHIQGDSPYRVLSLSATGDLDIGQGHLSFRPGGQAENVIRDPRQLFDQLFSNGVEQGDTEAAHLAARKGSLLDLVLGDANRLSARVGSADRQRLDQYFTAVRELEMQLGATATGSACESPGAPSGGGNWHSVSKAFMDLAVMAMACDLTRVAVVQYSNSWGVNYSDYGLGQGQVALGDWSDHFISHKLDDGDRATDLDGLDRGLAQQIADERVVLTSRFKVRRYAYLVQQLKNIATPTGTLYDETMAMYVSENGDGDSHSRVNMPILLAGGVGGFSTGRCVDAWWQPTGALHASILKYYGVDVGSYGDPAGTAIDGL